VPLLSRADKLLWRGLRWFYRMRQRRVKEAWNTTRAEFEELASHGYVVVCIGHPYWNPFVYGSGCEVLPFDGQDNGRPGACLLKA
jgi:hypothetical protein